MPDEFQPGDVVELIGGDGQRMVVDRLIQGLA